MTENITKPKIINQTEQAAEAVVAMMIMVMVMAMTMMMVMVMIMMMVVAMSYHLLLVNKTLYAEDSPGLPAATSFRFSKLLPKIITTDH